MSVDKTNRPPDFNSDVEKYGTWGEELFYNTHSEKFEKKGYTAFNVTKNPEYQAVDIDYVIAKNDAYKPKSQFDDIPYNVNDVLSLDDFEKVEVKVDTRTIDTGNVPYEMVSHSQLGWCLRTKCDKVFFIIVKEENDTVTPIKAVWLDMRKWHEFVADKATKKRCNYIRSENGIFDLLCKLTDLKDYGVVISEISFEKAPETE